VKSTDNTCKSAVTGIRTHQEDKSAALQFLDEYCAMTSSVFDFKNEIFWGYMRREVSTRITYYTYAITLRSCNCCSTGRCLQYACSSSDLQFTVLVVAIH
jgi:hypothetical protein